jgi:hypothetical protein
MNARFKVKVHLEAMHVAQSVIKPQILQKANQNMYKLKHFLLFTLGEKAGNDGGNK